MDTPKRQPRPMGTTLLSLEYQKEPTEEAKAKLLNHVISQYTLQGFRYCGQSIDVQSFSNILGLHEHEVNQYISSLSKNLGAFNSPDQIQDTIKTIASLSMNWAIQDRGLIMNQIELLSKSQGNQYKAFISAELTKALKTGQDANKNFMELYKTFFQNNNTNIIQIFQDKQPETDTIQYITPNDALELIDNQYKALPVPSPNSLPEPESNDLPSINNRQSLAKVLPEHELNRLSEKYRLGEISEIRDWGSDGPKVGKPKGTQELNSQGVTIPDLEALKPEGFPAPKPKRRNQHTDFDSRRGQTFVDFDDIPG